MADIIIGGLIAAAIVFIVVRAFRNRKRGGCSSCGSCSSCPSAHHCSK
ncbi:MAG: FeoB-associated Cys-rich membrane protein [Christensenella sp.]|nr:FeoB-associated Cys-rich membrane protein [Christensenella sp.]MEA5003362.1 FeoB-associated Cys-rich membrane protein [Christensenella sp.]